MIATFLRLPEDVEPGGCPEGSPDFRFGIGGGGPYCRFWLGRLGGAGAAGVVSPAACGWNLRVTLMAAWLMSTSERRPSSITVPERLLKVSAISRSAFTF